MKPTEPENGHNGLPDAVIDRSVELFLEKANGRRRTLSEIISTIAAEFKIQLKSWQIYECLRIATEKGQIRYFPAPERSQAEAVLKHFELGHRKVHVVAGSPTSPPKVAAVAAERVLAAIHEVAAHLKRPVGLGLGAGKLTFDVCSHLAPMLKQNPPPRGMNLICISAGCSPSAPQFSPLSFFNLFSDDFVKRRVGLFSQPLIRVEDFPALRKLPSVREAFAAADIVDVIPTSIGDQSDEHDMLRQFLRDSGVSGESLLDAGWIGNIQYRPFNSERPILEKPTDYRAVTLFDLDELKSLASRFDKRIILMVRRCSQCGMTKEKSLRVLFKPQFLPFHEAVMDSSTAVAVVSEAKTENEK